MPVASATCTASHLVCRRPTLRPSICFSGGARLGSRHDPHGGAAHPAGGRQAECESMGGQQGGGPAQERLLLLAQLTASSTLRCPLKSAPGHSNRGKRSPPAVLCHAARVQETLHINTAGSMEAAERQSEIQVGLAGWLAGVSRRTCQPTAVLSLRCCWPAHTTLLHHHLCSTPLCPSRSVLAMHRACCAA